MYHKISIKGCKAHIAYDPLIHKQTCAVGYNCPQCKVEAYSDLFEKYYQVMDRLDTFTKIQQQIITTLKENDPSFKTKVERFELCMRYRRIQHKRLTVNDRQKEITQHEKQTNSPPKNAKRKKSKKKSKGWQKGFLL